MHLFISLFSIYFALTPCPGKSFFCLLDDLVTGHFCERNLLDIGLSPLFSDRLNWGLGLVGFALNLNRD